MAFLRPHTNRYVVMVHLDIHKSSFRKPFSEKTSRSRGVSSFLKAIHNLQKPVLQHCAFMSPVMRIYPQIPVLELDPTARLEMTSISD
jgi:hypothetical protein